MTLTPTLPHPNRWWILTAVIIVLIMTPIDGSALNIAIPSLRSYFHLAQDQLALVAWVPLIYLLVIGSLILVMGRLGDLWGFRRLFLAGVVIFTTASALCGMAPTLNWLVAARAVQGLGACMMMALSSGIATALFPPQERGRALGIVGMGIAFGLVLGPVLGGWLIHFGDWRLIFFINLPIGLVGGLWCRRMLPPLNPGNSHRIDWLGALLAVIMLGALLLAITLGKDWGWHSPLTVGMFVLSLGAGFAFFQVERRHPEPMLELSLFAHPVFVGANLASMMNFIGQFSALFLTPVLLRDGYGYSAEKAGMVMASMPVVILVLAPLSGALSDRLGTRALAVTGESIVAAGLLSMAYMLASGQVALIPLALALIGIGAGLFQAPNNSAVMGSVPRTHLGVGGGVLAIMRNLGMSFGIAISSAVLAAGTQPFQHAAPALQRVALLHSIQVGFLVGAAFVLLGVVTSAIRQDHAPG